MQRRRRTSLESKVQQHGMSLLFSHKQQDGSNNYTSPDLLSIQCSGRHSLGGSSQMRRSSPKWNCRFSNFCGQNLLGHVEGKKTSRKSALPFLVVFSDLLAREAGDQTEERFHWTGRLRHTNDDCCCCGRTDALRLGTDSLEQNWKKRRAQAGHAPLGRKSVEAIFGWRMKTKQLTACGCFYFLVTRRSSRLRWACCHLALATKWMEKLTFQLLPVFQRRLRSSGSHPLGVKGRLPDRCLRRCFRRCRWSFHTWAPSLAASRAAPIPRSAHGPARCSGTGSATKR